MSFSTTEKINNANKLALQLVGTANESPGLKEWYNEQYGFSFITKPTTIWNSFSSIPAATTYDEAVINAAANPTIIEQITCRLTLDITSNGRTYVARQTYGDHTSNQLENWILPSLIRDNGSPSNGYMVRLSAGSDLINELTTGYLSDANGVSWVFNFPSGILTVSTDTASNYLNLYNTVGIYVHGFRYIGSTGGASSIDVDKIVTSPIYITHSDNRYELNKDFNLVVTDEDGKIIIGE
jgi:hypothetical protein